MPEPLTIVVPMAPVSALMPNRYKGKPWQAYAKELKEYRETTAYSALSARPSNWRTITGPIELFIHVGWPRGRRPDLETVVSATKGSIDGLADAGIFADDSQLAVLHATHEYGQPKPGYTRFTIVEIEEEAA